MLKMGAHRASYVKDMSTITRMQNNISGEDDNLLCIEQRIAFSKSSFVRMSTDNMRAYHNQVKKNVMESRESCTVWMEEGNLDKEWNGCSV